MSKLILIFFLAVLGGCQNHSQEVKPVSEAPYFSVREVLSASIALTAIIDWPAETVGLQKNLNISPDDARNLMLPVHPLWDEKGAEVLAQMPAWDSSKLKSLEAECKQYCECDFYLDLISRHPEILQGANSALVSFSKLSYVKSKSEVLRCLQSLPSIQNIVTFLKQELPKYKADSAL